ncbi:unnamed protein product [Durusdinium trenchii]|uniref:Uncharacterized protein n=1 Tax=Durusdinium trenchii TaxID=1381693 RepID=A0ABP0RC59_9DINO
MPGRSDLIDRIVDGRINADQDLSAPARRKYSLSSLEDLPPKRQESPVPVRPRRRAESPSTRPRSEGQKLKRSDTWNSASGRNSARPAAVPKLQMPGATASGSRRGSEKPQEKPVEETSKLIAEVQTMKAALRQEEDQLHQLRKALNKDSSPSPTETAFSGPGSPQEEVLQLPNAVPEKVRRTVVGECATSRILETVKKSCKNRSRSFCHTQGKPYEYEYYELF